jgi:hypothetical protein
VTVSSGSINQIVRLCVAVGVVLWIPEAVVEVEIAEYNDCPVIFSVDICCEILSQWGYEILVAWLVDVDNQRWLVFVCLYFYCCYVIEWYIYWFEV